jgi:hypothetical protein
MSEQTPLLPPQDSGNGTLRTENAEHLEENVSTAKGLSEHQRRIRQLITGPLLFVLLVLMIILLFIRGDDLYNRWLLRGDPHTAAKRILSRWPVIVRHLIALESILTIIFATLGRTYRPSHTLPRVRSKQYIDHQPP